jgi:hypothetical protein
MARSLINKKNKVIISAMKAESESESESENEEARRDRNSNCTNKALQQKKKRK